MKRFKISKEDIRPLAPGRGGCFATDKITVDGLPVRFLYREEPDTEIDSGWRFMSGLETDEYANDPENLAIYDVNTIANYDSSIIPLLDSPVGSTFEKPPGATDFVLVQDFDPEG